jgi:TP901 family phage tail tape measure protein
MESIGNYSRALLQIEAERQRNLKILISENDRYSASLSREDAALQKLREEMTLLNSSALGRFSLQMTGSANALKKMETNAYNASRMSTIFSQNLVTHPIKTLKTFTQSTEKAAIASEYFKQQLSFIAASRFGSIIIWGSIFAGIGKAIHGVIDANIELDKAIHKVASAFDAQEKSAKTYYDIQQKLIMGAVQFGQTYENVGKIMWELKSAGLSAQQSFAALETVQKLVSLGAEDINQSTRMMAGLYRSFGNDIKGATTEAEKFAEIGGIIGYVLNKSQGDVNDITQAFKYAGGAAKATGISLQEMAATILVANNAMLYGSSAGTGFAQAILNVSKKWKEYNRDFNLAIDPNKPLKWAEIINTLAKNQHLLNQEVGALGELAKDSNVRALRLFLSSTQGVEEFNRALNELNKGGMTGFLDNASDERLNNFESQLKRIKELIKSFTIENGGLLDSLTQNLKLITDNTVAYKRMYDAIKGLQDRSDLNWFEKQWADIKAWHQTEVELDKIEDTSNSIFQTWFMTSEQQNKARIDYMNSTKERAEQIKKEAEAQKMSYDEFQKTLTLQNEINESTEEQLKLTDEEIKKYNKLKETFTDMAEKLSDIKMPDFIDMDRMKTSLSDIFNFDGVRTNFIEFTKELVPVDGIYSNIKDNTKAIQDSMGYWKFPLQQSKELLGGITFDLAQMKENTPVAEFEKILYSYQKSQQALEIILEESILTEGHQERLSKQTADWFEKAKAVKNEYSNIAKTLADSNKAQEELNKESQRHFNLLIETGKISKYEAERQLQQQREMAGWSILTANTRQDEVAALEKRMKINEALLKIGVRDGRINDEIIRDSESIVRILDEMARKKIDIAKESTDKIYSDTSVKTLEGIETMLSKIPYHIKLVTNGITEKGGMNESISKTKGILEDITTYKMPLWIQQIELAKNTFKLLNEEILTGYGEGNSERDNRRG